MLESLMILIVIAVLTVAGVCRGVYFMLTIWAYEKMRENSVDTTE